MLRWDLPSTPACQRTAGGAGRLSQRMGKVTLLLWDLFPKGGLTALVLIYLWIFIYSGKTAVNPPKLVGNDPCLQPTRLPELRHP
jgi:hypothetical protein